MGTNDTKGAKNRVEWLYFLYKRIAFKAVAENVKMKKCRERRLVCNLCHDTVFVKGAQCHRSAEHVAERHHQCLSQHQIDSG